MLATFAQVRQKVDARLLILGEGEPRPAAIGESLAATHGREALKAGAQDFSIDKAVDQYEKLLFPGASSSGDA